MFGHGNYMQPRNLEVPYSGHPAGHMGGPISAPTRGGYEPIQYSMPPRPATLNSNERAHLAMMMGH